MEEVFMLGYFVWVGGFVILNDDEEVVFKLLGEEGGLIEFIRVKFGMIEE